MTALALLAAGCGDWHSDPDGFTERDLALFSTMVLTKPASDPRNEYADVAKARELGQKLFFDLGLAIRPDGKSVSCASCHSPKLWFSDPNRTSLSSGLGVTARNSPSLVNVGFYNAWGWDGRADAIWVQAINAFESTRTMSGTPTSAWERVRAAYPDAFFEAFGVRIETLSPRAAYPFILKAWGAYLASLVSRRAPFDLWASGEDPNALGAQQKRGLKLFVGKAGCIQ